MTQETDMTSETKSELKMTLNGNYLEICNANGDLDKGRAVKIKLFDMETINEMLDYSERKRDPEYVEHLRALLPKKFITNCL